MRSITKHILLAIGLFAGYLAVSTLGQFDWGGSFCEMPVAVEVLNGCGEPGIAEKVASHLRGCGFDVMYVGNAGDFDYDETLVIDRTGDREKTRAVGCALGHPPTVHQVCSEFFVDVTVILGGDITTSPILSNEGVNQL
jgi:hypothetical protein